MRAWRSPTWSPRRWLARWTAPASSRRTWRPIHVGNAFGQLFTGQGQLGAMPATVEPRLWGKPAARHEAACASGSVAVLSGHGGHRGRPLRLRAGDRRGAGAQRAGRRGARASRRGRLDRPRGPGRQVHVAVHVQPAGRRVRPPLRPERRAPARDRRTQHAQRQGQPAGPDPRLDVRPGQLRRRRPRQPDRRGTAAAHRLRPGHRRHRRRAPGLRQYRQDRLGHRARRPHRRLGPRHRRAGAAAQVRPQPGPAVRLPARPPGGHRRVPARAA